MDFTAESLHSGGHSGTTIFPMGQGQGATWNVTMAELVGAAIGREARASGVAHGLCPVINIPASVSNRARDHMATVCRANWTRMFAVQTDPRFGRTQESYGEDPFIVGTMSAAATRGIQGPPR